MNPSAKAIVVVLALAGVLLLVVAPGGGENEATRRAVGGPVAAFGSLATIRPDVPLPAGGETKASLIAAQGEQESFQLSIDGGRVGFEDVAVAVGDLRGPAGATIPADSVVVYREAFYEVTFARDGPDADTFADRAPSDGEGEPGLWPDALIPERDAFYGEDRAAFPYDIAAGDRLAAWIDITVPAGQQPGVYRGKVDVLHGGEELASVPMELRVLDFELPPTSSLPSAFGLDATALCAAHTGAACAPSEERPWLLHYLYERAALDNRTTISAPYPSGPSRPPTPGPELEGFERYIAPLATGEVDGSEGCEGGQEGAPDCLHPPRLPGARMTTLSAYGVSYGSSPEEPVEFGCAAASSDCLGRWRQIAERDGFEHRFFLYLCDEPGYEEWIWSLCAKAARNAARSGWPEVPRLVTASIQEADALGATEIADTLAVPIEKLAGKVGELAGNQRPAYDPFVSAPGKQLWLYTACGSFGCDDDQGPYWDGWAGYGIDQPASQARAVSWLAMLYGASGELYYNTTIALPGAWQDQYRFGGNGDGTLFYPGLPDGEPADADAADEIEIGDAPAIGGTHEIPIESIRLKRIRDGREDYEYTRLAAAEAKGREAFLVARRLFAGAAPAGSVLDSATHSATFTQAELDAARCELARLLDASVPACP